MFMVYWGHIYYKEEHMATKKATSTKKKAPAVKSAASKTTVKTVSAQTTKRSRSENASSTLFTGGFWRALAAEFIGTFLLVVAIFATKGEPLYVTFALVGIVLIVGGISGAHVNPAITVGAWATRRINWVRALGYIFAQVLGAAAAYFTMNAFIGGAAAVSDQAAMYGQSAPALLKATSLAAIESKVWFIFFAELLGTAILGFAVAAATRAKDNIHAAFSVGLGILVALLFAATAASYVGGSAIINPAVALSLQAYTLAAPGLEVTLPAIMPYVVYAIAPIVGGVLGFLIYDLVRGKVNEK